MDVSGLSRESLVKLGRMAESCCRFDDLRLVVRRIVEQARHDLEPLSVEERNLLAVAFKGLTGGLREALERADDIREKGSDPADQLMSRLKHSIKQSLAEICHEAIDLVQKYATDDHLSFESRAFYLKFTGDQHRYLVECDEAESIDLAQMFYKKGWEIAESNLQPSHPVRLSLALNLAVFQASVLADVPGAVVFAQEAAELAEQDLENMPQYLYQDALHAVQLLQYNIKDWESLLSQSCPSTSSALSRFSESKV